MAITDEGWVTNTDYQYIVAPDGNCLPIEDSDVITASSDAAGTTFDAGPLTVILDAIDPDGPGPTNPPPGEDPPPEEDEDDNGGGGGVVIDPPGETDPPIVIPPPPVNPPPPPTPPPTTPWLGYGHIVGVVAEAIAPATPTIQAIAAPWTFTVTSGAMPPGLSLNASTGVISGTPTLQGAYNFTIRCNGVTTSVTSAILKEGSVLPPGTPVNWTIRRIGDTFYWIFNGVVYQTWRMPRELYDQLRSSQGYLGWWTLDGIDPEYSPPNTTAPPYTSFVGWCAQEYRKEQVGGGLARYFGRLQNLATIIEGDSAYVTDLPTDGVRPTIPGDGQVWWVSPAKASILAASGLTRYMRANAGVPNNDRTVI